MGVRARGGWGQGVVTPRPKPGSALPNPGDAATTARAGTHNPQARPSPAPPEVASSRKATAGLWCSSRATEMRCCSPRDSTCAQSTSASSPPTLHGKAAAQVCKFCCGQTGFTLKAAAAA